MYFCFLQVIAHTHYIDTHANTAMAKRVVPMSLHRYNWDLPQEANGNQPYFACQWFGLDCSTLKVLAFTPAVEKLLASSASWHEFAFLLQGLAALGTALGRAVAWPSLPCNTSWVSRLAPGPFCHAVYCSTLVAHKTSSKHHIP